MKTLDSSKNASKKIRRQEATDWENVYANHISDKRLAFRIYNPL